MWKKQEIFDMVNEMKSIKQIREKIEQLEEYLQKGKPLSELYSLEETQSFLGGIKWVINEE